MLQKKNCTSTSGVAMIFNVNLPDIEERSGVIFMNYLGICLDLVCYFIVGWLMDCNEHIGENRRQTRRKHCRIDTLIVIILSGHHPRWLTGYQLNVGSFLTAGRNSTF